MSSPSVSVVIPVYRAAEYVGEAVRSALAEPETLEVILVEDGSDDGSLEVCRRLAEDARVRLFTHDDGANRGAAASRNLAISHAEGRTVAFLDADDWFLPGRLSGPVAVLEADPAIDGVYDAVGVEFETDEAREEWQSSMGGGDLTTMNRRVAADDLLSAILLEGAGMFCTDGVVVRRSVFDRVGLFRTDLRVAEDTEMWWRLAAACRLVPGSLESAVAVRRRHGKNTLTPENPERVGAGFRAALSVYRWGRKMRLPPEKRLVLLRALLGAVLMGGGRTGRLLRSLAACPWLPATREFWRVTGGRLRRGGRKV
ncbi:MAG: glycosyltransferase family 2 protein [Planctomycetota bacterium]